MCAESIFPFNHIVVDDVFQSALFELPSDCCLLDPDFVQPKMVDPFNLNDEKDYIPCTDIDPDNCFYNELNFPVKRIATIIMKIPSIILFWEFFKTVIYFLLYI